MDLRAEPRPASAGCDCSAQAACCGPPAGPPAAEDELPGYEKCHFVLDFLDTAAGRVPVVETRLTGRDRLTAFAARVGLWRNEHRVAPGLYAAGSPGAESGVFVTASYKLSFAALRRALSGRDAWILVVDTRGINVWCAAGKGTFSTEEVARQIDGTGLAQLVSHRRLVLPQLSATGVSAHRLKKMTGFTVKWGPVRARDLPAYLDRGMEATTDMRRVGFNLYDRLVLVPVELSQVLKPSVLVLLAMFAISGIGPGVYSFGAMWSRGLMMALAYVLGVLAGTVGTAALLPVIPGRALSAKGALMGVFAGAVAGLVYMSRAGALELLSMVLVATAISSYLGMNYTGTTPYTSPSGVEKEMRRAMPAQAGGALLALMLWVAAPFM
ncbi:MAG: mercury methylation corrinoid protein HgcA [Desulfatibacillaceae bacterium]